jgi:hypothetical protein
VPLGAGGRQGGVEDSYLQVRPKRGVGGLQLQICWRGLAEDGSCFRSRVEGRCRKG